MTLQWVAADLATGRILADLPGISADYPLRRTIGLYDTASVHLYLDGAPENWERAVKEGASVLACYDDTVMPDGTQPNAIMWAGWVVSQVRNTATDTVDLSLATIEAYFDRRQVTDTAYVTVGQNAIIADLISKFVVTVGGTIGIPLTVVTSGAGAVQSATYLTTDWSTVYSKMTQLNGLQNGPEFTCDWAWSPDGQSILPTLHIADRIGTAANPGMDPATTWAMPGCVSDASQTRDYSSGKGANRVRAYTSGSGDAGTPISPYSVAASLDGRPTFDYIYQPAASITSQAALNSYAAQAVAFLAPGSVALTLTGAIVESPRLGFDWNLGDDVGYQIGGLDENGNDTVLAFPGGIQGVGRAIAYEIGGQSGQQPTTITPILAQATLY